jgi:hypothetical protein
VCRGGRVSAPHEADVHAEAAVPAAAVQAHERAERHGRPLRVLLVAVHANLCPAPTRPPVSEPPLACVGSPASAAWPVARPARRALHRAHG